MQINKTMKEIQITFVGKCQASSSVIEAPF